MRTMVHPDLPADTGDFRLISRRCLDALRTMPEQHRFLRGMVAWSGFAQTAVRYDRPAARRARRSTRFARCSAWRGLPRFPLFPALEGNHVCRAAIALLGLTWGSYSIVRCLAYGDTIRGWTSLMAGLCAIGGAVLISNAIVGSYVGQIFEEIKQRPLYIVSSLANVGQASRSRVQT